MFPFNVEIYSFQNHSSMKGQVSPFFLKYEHSIPEALG